ncbi:ABC transporter permease [Methylomagnum sp.]
MNINPEFERQLWLEFPLSRQIGVPLVLAVIFGLTYTLDHDNLTNITTNTAGLLFLLIVSWGGSRQVVDSLLDEKRNRTWDTQRLSALGPWAMVWGKLFGSTLVVWYGALICIVMYALAADRATTPNLPWLYVYGLLGGLGLQALSFLMGLLALRPGPANGGGITVAMTLAALSMLGPWGMSLTKNPLHDVKIVAWYGLPISLSSMTLTALAIAVFWVGVGCYRLMAQELRIRSLPWVWLAFALFLSGFLAGFLAPELGAGPSFCLVGFLAGLGLTYVGLLSESNEPMRYKRLLAYATQSAWQRFGEELPPWCVSLALATLFGLALSALGWPKPVGVGDGWRLYPLPLLLLAFRDVGVFLGFSFGNNPQRALMSTVLVLGLLYGVIPGIIEELGWTWLEAIVFPLGAGSVVIGLVCAGAQALMALGWAYGKWRRRVYQGREAA